MARVSRSSPRPIYLFLAYVMWEGNEEAFAEWVLKEHERIHTLRREDALHR